MSHFGADRERGSLTRDFGFGKPVLNNSAYSRHLTILGKAVFAIDVEARDFKRADKLARCLSWLLLFGPLSNDHGRGQEWVVRCINAGLSKGGFDAAQ